MGWKAREVAFRAARVGPLTQILLPATVHCMSETIPPTEPKLSAMEDLDDLVRRLSDPTTSAEEAERVMSVLDGHEPKAALPLFGLLGSTAEPAVLYAVSRLLARWARRPVTAALMPALESMIREPGVADLNRMAAAGLLETYGREVDYVRFVRNLNDLDSVARRAAASLLPAFHDPFALINVLDQLASMSVERVLGLIDEVTELGDSRAEPFLAALAHSGNPDVAISAIAAIDILRLLLSGRTLDRVAKHHPDEGARAQARATLVRTSGFSPELRTDGQGSAAVPTATAPSPRSKASRIVAETVEATDSGQLLLLRRASELQRDAWDVFTIHLGGEGAGPHAVAERLNASEYAALRSRFERAAALLEPQSTEMALANLERAADRTLRSGGGLGSVAYAVWLPILELEVDRSN
jgi:hypothetical protein